MWLPALFLRWPLGSGREPAVRVGVVPVAALAPGGEASPTPQLRSFQCGRKGPWLPEIRWFLLLGLQEAGLS